MRELRDSDHCGTYTITVVPWQQISSQVVTLSPHDRQCRSRSSRVVSNTVQVTPGCHRLLYTIEVITRQVTPHPLMMLMVVTRHLTFLQCHMMASHVTRCRRVSASVFPSRPLSSQVVTGNRMSYKFGSYQSMWYVALRCVAVHSIIWHCIVLRCDTACVMRCVTLQCVAPPCATLRGVALRCVTLRCVALDGGIDYMNISMMTVQLLVVVDIWRHHRTIYDHMIT